MSSQSAPSGSGTAALLAVAVFGLIVGIGFKISAVPFHFWCPDVFEGASIDVSAFLSVASKGAALALLLRVLMTFAAGLGYHNVPGVSLSAIAGVVGVIGAITATVGNTAAFVQNNIKRLLAYSSIAHAGYMMVRAFAARRATAPATCRASPPRPILLYLSIYMFMNLGVFTAAGLIWRQTGSEDIRDYAGLGRRSPILALCITLFMFSLIGLPPLAGFSAKFYLLGVLIQNGGMWWWLVGVIGVNTVLSLYYYVRVVKVMYLQNSDEPAFFPNPIGLAVSVLCAAMLVGMFVLFNPLQTLTKSYGKMYLGGAATGSANTRTASVTPGLDR
jgi:NADH-quinone oxidoreductase subunit N